jgi:hypothetical protein
MKKIICRNASLIIELFFDGLLLLCFIVQAFLLGCLLAYGHLPLPAKWVSENITTQLPPGLSIKADSYSLTLDGTIRMENIELHLDGIEDAFFNAAYAHAKFGIRGDKQQPFHLKECVLLNGLISLPAVYSPDGIDSPILENIALRFLPTERGVTVDSFAARHEDIRLRGSINWTAAKKTYTPIKVRESADRLFKQVANVLKQKQKFNGLTRPTILFEINAESDGPLHLLSRVSSRAYNHPRIQAKNLTLDAQFSLTNQKLISESPIWLKADEVELPPYRTRASSITAKLEPDEWGTLLQGEWPNMELLAGTLDIHDIHLETPRIKLSAHAFPEITFSGLASGLQGAAEFSGSVNVETKTADIQAAGSLDLLLIAPENLASRLPNITMERPPYYNLSLNFNEGFDLNRGELRAQVDGLEVDGLHFDHICFRGDYHEGLYSINRSYLRRDWQWLELGFNLDSSTDDYALTLKGFAKPDDYNALLPRWWEGIFRDFDFEEVESGLGDFVIYGNTQDRVTGFFFGHATARNVGYQGVQVDEGSLFVRGNGPYAEVHRLDARSGEGYVRGDIRFASRLDEVRGPMSVRLDLDAQLPLTDTKKLFDENIAEILTDFETDALPRTVLRGAIFNQAYPEFQGLSHIDLTANCPFPLTYKGLPLDSLSFELLGRAGITYLRDMRIGYAGGSTQAEADIITAKEGPAQTRFRLALKDADQDQAIGQLTALKNRESTPATERTTPGKGRLDLKLHALGPAGNPLQMQGYGSFQIKDEALYAIQLFGPLSELLQNIRLGFTSFALNEMRGNFALKDTTVRFEQIEINGPRTRIAALGTMGLEDEALAMRVSVYLFGNAGNPESNFRKLSDLISRPIPNILEFELSGTPKDQQWRSLYDLRKFIPQF